MTGWGAVVIPLFSSLLGAAVSALIIHRFAISRELLGERRARRVDHLIDAWRAILSMANRSESTPATEAQREAFERALTDIMLLGEAAEIEATASFIGSVGRGEQTNLDGIVNALRSSLRDELQLSTVPLPADRVLRLDWTR